MKILRYLVFLILIFIGAAYIFSYYGEKAVKEPDKGSGYKKITPKEALEIMEGDKSYILLDVRTESEFSELRIDGATLIPDYEISKRASGEIPDKEALILVYCRSGRRSKNAALELLDMGYTNVYDFGGIIDWPYETVSG